MPAMRARQLGWAACAALQGPKPCDTWARLLVQLPASAGTSAHVHGRNIKAALLHADVRGSLRVAGSVWIAVAPPVAPPND